MSSTAEHLHNAQLAARVHVCPHIRAAARTALVEGRADDAATFTMLAALIAGELDPLILRYGASFLRFVEGGP